MFLLARPPVLRWVVAGTVLLVAVWLDLRPSGVALHPHALRDIEAGTVVEAADVELRSVPDGVLDEVVMPFTASRTITAGSPILATDGEPSAEELPPGWWEIEIEVPENARPGAEIAIVVLDGQTAGGAPVRGIVTGEPRADGFGATVAVCAFPEPDAAKVAAAATAGRIAVMTSARGS